VQFYGDLVNKYKVASLKIGRPEEPSAKERRDDLPRAYMVGLIRDNCPT